MPQKCETRAGKARASRMSLVGPVRDTPITPHFAQVQRLTSRHHVRPEIAALIASLAFGEERHA